MNAKVLRVLEYDKVIHMLEQKATSDPGRQLCRDLVPMTDLAQIEQAQTETADALTRIFQKGSLNFGSNKPLGMCLRSLEIGSTLSSEELLRIAGLLENTARVKNFGRSDKDEEQQDSLTEYFHCLEPLAPLSKEIRRCIIDVDEIADDASPALKKIRRSMVLTGEKIHNQLNSMVNGSVRNYLQDAVITTRDGRYCIPVKAEYKGQVPGMVHDQSSTGSTFFIEPAAVVSLNNQLRELEIEEQKEIAVILANLSAEAGAHTLEIAENQRIMTQLDFIFAKASLAMDQNASRPLFNDEHIVRIRQGRHPLLDRKKVVPIDVELGKNFDLLVITGPNTGGKTVCLKTVGLFTLMGQAGLHIPALDRSQLSVFTEVFADIGDEQSIEQSLSTFSGHMTNLVRILSQVTPKCLVLIDEIGAGTDPEEGTALAMAILEHLREQGIRTIATTHYGELKAFAYTQEGVENASVEFDIETLRPTYRLLIGVAGSSNAFAISQRLGLPKELVEKARIMAGGEHQKFETVLSVMEEHKRASEKERQEAAALRQESVRLRQIIEREKQSWEIKKKDAMIKARAEADELMRQTRLEAEAVIRDLKQHYSTSGASALQESVDSARRKIREKISELNPLEASETPVVFETDATAKVVKGSVVLVANLGQQGNVLSVEGDSVVVQLGALKMTVARNQCRVLKRSEQKSLEPARKARQLSTEKMQPVSREIDIRGMNNEEASYVLEKYLDDAVLAGLDSVSIIHGKGTGALRKGVQTFLAAHPRVKGISIAEVNQGGTGVSVVKLA